MWAAPPPPEEQPNRPARAPARRPGNECAGLVCGQFDSSFSGRGISERKDTSAWSNHIPGANKDSMWIIFIYTANKQRHSISKRDAKSRVRRQIQTPDLLSRIAGEPQGTVTIADAVATGSMPLLHHGVGGWIDSRNGKLEDRGPYSIGAESNLSAKSWNACRN